MTLKRRDSKLNEFGFESRLLPRVRRGTNNAARSPHGFFERKSIRLLTKNGPSQHTSGIAGASWCFGEHQGVILLLDQLGFAAHTTVRCAKLKNDSLAPFQAYVAFSLAEF